MLRSVIAASVLGIVACSSSSSSSSSDPAASSPPDGGTPAVDGGPGSDTHYALTHRPSEPVIATGAQLPALVGVAPSEIVAFTRSAGAWRSIPVQVDERLLGDFCTVYAKAKLGDAAPCKTSLSIKTLFYADPKTYTGADPDASFDADDEIVLMARDTGDRWGGAGEPTGVKAGSAVEIEVADGDEKAFAYLFVRSDSTLAPSAGQDLVQYGLKFSGVPANFDYKNDYPFTGLGSCGYNPGDAPIPCNPPILEDSVVSTKSYERHFSARWVTDRLRITRGASDGADILDIAQARFAPNICGRTVGTFSTSEGAFIANIDGPLRAIRSYLGANSGPLTQRTHLFYDAMEVTQTMLRVHEVGSIMDLEDYASDAKGMRYASSEVPAGVAIDGQPDTVGTTVPKWELVSGPHGSVMHVLAVSMSQPLATVAYYLDDANADTANDQCELSDKLTAPDKIAWGQSGVRIAQTIPDTDPRNGSKEHVYFERLSYYEEPAFSAADADARFARGALRVAAHAAVGSDACPKGDCAPSKKKCGDAICDPWENSVNCPADCGGSGPASECGNGTCGAGEQKLSCASDCWTPGYVGFASCLSSKCASPDGACGDELPCVDYVVCVAECVKGGTALATCQTTCSGTVALTTEQRDYGDALLTCAAQKKCAP